MKPRFKHFSLPRISVEGDLPTDLELEIPTKSKLPPDQQHFLLYIPWNEKYRDNIPQDFQSFFSCALPYLNVRTTNVHVAICMGYLNEAIAAHPSDHVNRRVLGCSLILHDCGWSNMTELEIAQSLGVTGLKLNNKAIGPKEKHAFEGQKLTQEFLKSFTFHPPLSPQETKIILSAVLYHDQPELVFDQRNKMLIEIQLLVDLDHLWSFTKENFWQDTLRKGVLPADYVKNLSRDLPNYFVTNWGKTKAETLLRDRYHEVLLLQNNN